MHKIHNRGLPVHMIEGLKILKFVKQNAFSLFYLIKIEYLCVQPSYIQCQML